MYTFFRDKMFDGTNCLNSNQNSIEHEKSSNKSIINITDEKVEDNAWNDIHEKNDGGSLNETEGDNTCNTKQLKEYMNEDPILKFNVSITLLKEKARPVKDARSKEKLSTRKNHIYEGETVANLTSGDSTEESELLKKYHVKNVPETELYGKSNNSYDNSFNTSESPRCDDISETKNTVTENSLKSTGKKCTAILSKLDSEKLCKQQIGRFRHKGGKRLSFGDNIEVNYASPNFNNAITCHCCKNSASVHLKDTDIQRLCSEHQNDLLGVTFSTVRIRGRKSNEHYNGTENDLLCHKHDEEVKQGGPIYCHCMLKFGGEGALQAFHEGINLYGICYKHYHEVKGGRKDSKLLTNKPFVHYQNCGHNNLCQQHDEFMRSLCMNYYYK